MTTPLEQQLDPTRFPNMSPQMAAIVGFVLDREFTDPAIAEVSLTPDGGVIVVPVGSIQSSSARRPICGRTSAASAWPRA